MVDNRIEPMIFVLEGMRARRRLSPLRRGGSGRTGEDANFIATTAGHRRIRDERPKPYASACAATRGTGAARIRLDEGGL